jgi:hypothetical protein
MHLRWVSDSQGSYMLCKSAQYEGEEELASLLANPLGSASRCTLAVVAPGCPDSLKQGDLARQLLFCQATVRSPHGANAADFSTATS